MHHVTQADGVCVTRAARDVAYLAWILGRSISVPLRSSLPLPPEGTGQSPCRPSFQDHGPFRHPDPCQALPQSDGSPVARAHVMRIAMQGQQLCLQPQGESSRTVP